MKKIILASSSPRRKEILEKSGLSFEIDASNYEEDMTQSLMPEELAKVLAKGKAEDVAKRYKDAIVIGADTFISLDDKVLGKPHTAEKAKEMLKNMNGRFHSVWTGFAIIDTGTGKMVNKAVETKVFFKHLTDEDIDGYVSTGEPLDRAGAYAIQDHGAVLVGKIEGDFFNVMGLPLSLIIDSLKEFGISIWKER